MHDALKARADADKTLVDAREAWADASKVT